MECNGIYVKDVKDRSNTPKGCNAICVEDVKDRSNTPKGCNAMYVKDVKDGKEHTDTFFIIPFLIWYHLNVMVSISDFQSEKSFGKLRLRTFQPYHQILCILKHVGDVRDRSSTPKGCNAIYVGDIRDCNNLQYTYDLMVWLKSPKSQLSKTCFGLKIH